MSWRALLEEACAVTVTPQALAELCAHDKVGVPPVVTRFDPGGEASAQVGVRRALPQSHTAQA